MTDLLDELRDANPVDPTTVEVPPRLAARVLGPAPETPRRTRRVRLPLSVVATAAAVCVVVLLLPGKRGPEPSLAARAYAATSGAGVIHWRTEQHNYSNGHDIEHVRIEGWARNGVVHSVRWVVRRGNARLTSDSRSAANGSKTWIAASDDYFSGPPMLNRTTANPLAGGDPFAIFRDRSREPGAPGGEASLLAPLRLAIAFRFRSDAPVARPVRVLSIDGGGIRGYLPALVLAEIERRAGTPAATQFDLVVGTSTGGIIGIGLAAGLSAQALADFYPTYGRRIFGGAEEPAWKTTLLGTGTNFAERMGNAARRAGGPLGGNAAYGGNARHRPHGLEAVLREVLGDTRLSQARMSLAITSFDGLLARPVVFSRRDARADATWDLTLRDVARATSAAPTYFPPHEIDWAGRRCSFVDGGVWANNPAAVAVAESIRLTSAAGVTGQSVFLVSLGTGMASAAAAFRGTDSWIGSAGDLVKTATSVSAGEVLARRCVPPQSYRRLQVIDERIAGAMDDPSPQRLGALNAAANALIQARSNDLDYIVARLRG